MGIEIQINSLEEMCDLICNNQIPKQNNSRQKGSDKNRNECIGRTMTVETMEGK